MGLSEHLKANNPVMLGGNGHGWSLYDVKMENGIWYAYIFEPNNREKYTKNSKGQNGETVHPDPNGSPNFDKGRFRIEEKRFRKVFALDPKKRKGKVSVCLRLGYFDTYTTHVAPVQKDF